MPGSNDPAVNARQYKNSDIDSDGDGQVNDADTVDGKHASELGSDLAATNPSDVAADRALSTWYQNTTGNPLRVEVRTDTGTTSSGDRAATEMHANTSTSSNRVALGSMAQSTGAKVASQAATIVPDGYYYKAEPLAESSRFTEWYEQEVHTV